jgi:REP element-mobilizing transposase RayT
VSVRTSNRFRDGIYFCTFTCYNWLPLIDITNAYGNIYESFQKWKEKECYLLGYVIMPNHVHFLAYTANIENNIIKLVSNAKRFLAYYIVKELRNQNRYDLLMQMMQSVKPSQQKRSKIHQVFTHSFDCKPCFSDEFIEQKLYYMHFNPVSGKWKLVDDYRDYPHSSAGFYELGIECKAEILNYRET